MRVYHKPTARARRNRRPLWWDDASYIAYQSYDPELDGRLDAWRVLPVLNKQHVCQVFEGGIHSVCCPKRPAPDPNEPPF
jgi:hypothetical protein